MPPSPRTLQLQRSMMSAAKSHNTTQDSFAAHMGVSRGVVSHLTTSGPQAAEMSLGQLVGLLEHVGEGQAAADVLGVLAALCGCRVVPDDADGASVRRDQVIKETAEALALLANPASNRDELVREMREAGEHLFSHADALNARR